VVLCWLTGVVKGPERLMAGVRQYRRGTLGVVPGWGFGGEVQVGHATREVLHCCREGFLNGSDVNAALEEGAEERKKHLFPDGRLKILVEVMVGNPSARRPMLGTVSWKSETKWLRLPLAGRGERGAQVVLLRGPPSRWWWEAMLEGGIGAARPK